ncbi:MAG: COX15/CtaA family protein [Chthoniobacterales bacterium]|nr:COX15/CtaA family protein [Chthoniobacterales bacterium]
MTNEKSHSLQPTISSLVLHWTGITTAILTFLLIFSGGLVTSKGVGMSVPDWPTTYGYNMFLFPLSKWVGGIFYEHSHRLLASGIGLLTVILCVVTFVVEKRRFVRSLAVAAVIAVVLQGILGGLRVTLYKDELGIFHGVLAQSFFALLVIFSAVTSQSFYKGKWFGDQAAASLRWLALVGLFFIYFQLTVAAMMRHSHLGLSIPDFPTAYGHIFPEISPKALATINQERLAQGMMPTTVIQICLQMVHRLGALSLFGVVLLLIIRSRELLPTNHWACSWSLYWGLLLVLQILLGAWTIWSNKAADIATTHMALGALLLGGAMLFVFRLFAAQRPIEKSFCSAICIPEEK